jgi:CO/xanthine dehydrogenase FAD-binding subunit
MENNYFRPKSIEEALNLLELPNKVPLSGGTLLSRKRPISSDMVDLQDLGLDQINKNDQGIELGGMVILQNMLIAQVFPKAFQRPVELEAPINIRNSASVGGLIATCDGRSSIVTSFLAMNALITLEPGHEQIGLYDFLKFRFNKPHKSLITSIRLQNIKDFSFQYISRTKFDRPIICVAFSILANGNKLLAIGGFGEHPILVSDGSTNPDLPSAARNAFNKAEDEWASAEYRSAMAEILTNRCLDQLKTLPK